MGIIGRRHLWRYIILVGAALLLAGCGVSATAATSCTGLGSGPATTNGTTVTLATDHSTYQQNGNIQATVTNKLSVPISAANHQASCTILSVQQQINGQWQALPKTEAGCAQASPTVLIRIDPGKSYTATIMPGEGLRSGAAFAPGTYRLALIYFTANPGKPSLLPPNVGGGTPGTGPASYTDATTLYSQPITVQACVDTSVTPIGASGTPSSSGGASATPVISVGTVVPSGTTSPANP